jgi:uncharacterized protein (UPF0332 family)
MKKKAFLFKLKGDDIIKFVSPSGDIAESYIIKSDKSLISAKVVLDIDNFEDSVALLYYSMYYSVLALLFVIGIKSENHTCSIILLKELFGINNEDIFNAKKERIDKQYYVDFQVTGRQVKDLIVIAENFNSRVQSFMDSLTNSDVQKYRIKAEEFFDMG